MINRIKEVLKGMKEMRTIQKPETDMEPLLRTEQIIKYLDIGIAKFYRTAKELKKQGLPIFKVGAEWRASRKKIEAWVEEQSKGV
jgi:hypothetical protein